MNILIIEDDPQVSRLLDRRLTTLGYQVTTINTPPQSSLSIPQQRPDLIILDMAPTKTLNALALCRLLHRRTNVPIIALFATNDYRTRVDTLNAGADDCLTKPFNIPELHARIQAISRRAGTTQLQNQEEEIHYGPLHIDLRTRRVILNDSEIHLTPKQYHLLSILATHPGQVVPHAILLARVWGAQYTRTQTYLHTHINQIRHKLRDRQFIYTEPGIGYRFEPPGSTEQPLENL